MEEKLINIIDYERAWKKTLLYKFGKKNPFTGMEKSIR